MTGTERRLDPPYDDPLPDVTTDERGVGWGDDADDERAADERLLADRPPHWDDRD